MAWANVEEATKKRALYARELARTGMAKWSAEKAGYVSDTEMHRLNRDPRIAEQVALERARLFNTELGGLAYATLHDLLTVPKTPPAVRFQAAKFVMEACGFSRADGPAPLDTDKPLADMTLAELGAFIRQGEATLNAMKERTIEHNPENIGSAAKVEALEVADLLG